MSIALLSEAGARYEGRAGGWINGPFTKQQGQPGSERCQRGLPLSVQRARYPSCLPDFDRIRLRIVLRGDRKARMPQRARNII